MLAQLFAVSTVRRFFEARQLYSCNKFLECSGAWRSWVRGESWGARRRQRRRPLERRGREVGGEWRTCWFAVAVAARVDALGLDVVPLPGVRG